MASSLADGKDWPTALVEAMAVWPSPRDTHEGRERNYFIAGEAFDWLSLAERLLDTIRRQVPKGEREELLFHGEFPPPFDMDRFKNIIGVDKYRGYLNYYYGVTVEEALQLAVELEVMKQYTSNGLHYKDEAAEVAFRRIYRLSRDEMLADFREAIAFSVDTPASGKGTTSPCGGQSTWPSRGSLPTGCSSTGSRTATRHG